MASMVSRVQKFPGSKGMGVIALQDIAAGDLIAEYVGAHLKCAAWRCQSGTSPNLLSCGRIIPQPLRLAD